MTGCRSAALEYASRGWPVVPVHPILADRSCGCRKADCDDAGKHPIWKDWPNAATVEPAAIRASWNEFPLAGVGIVTGQRSGLFVFDVDTKPGKRGDLTLEDLERAHGRLPYSVRARTGSGGLHIYFILPEGRSVSNHSPFAGIDIRGTGGYVVAPPSPHASGGRYEWLDGGPEECSLEPAPEWLLEMLRPAAEYPSAGPFTGPFLPDESAVRLLTTLLRQALAKITKGGSRHGAWVWLVNQLRDSRVQRETLALAEEPFLAACGAAAGERTLRPEELRRVTSWAYGKAPREPHPLVEAELLPARLGERLDGEDRTRVTRSLARCVAPGISSSRGVPGRVLWELIRGWNETRNSPPLPDRELEAIFVDAINKRAEAKPPTDDQNGRRPAA